MHLSPLPVCLAAILIGFFGGTYVQKALSPAEPEPQVVISYNQTLPAVEARWGIQEPQ